MPLLLAAAGGGAAADEAGVGAREETLLDT
jgi:hypothetical protein